MAASGFTPISLYYSDQTGHAPVAGNLVYGELAINIFDGKLYYKDASNNVKIIAGTGGSGVVAGSNTQIQFNNNGVFGASSAFTWDGTTLSATKFAGALNGSVGATTPSTGAFTSVTDTGLTSGRVTYATTGGLLTDSANLTFTGTRLGINKTSPAVTLDLTATDAISLPVGTTGQRPAGSTGYIRFNSDITKFEGYNGSQWSQVGGGATGGGGDSIFWENGQTVTTNYTITTGMNAGTFGPVQINAGVTVTVPDGSVWSIV